VTLKLGLIGMSEGNGHPYSWAAICNGYSPEHMAACEFPVIPEYLAEQDWPDARIPGVEVTHVWTQAPVLSNRIARAALIPHVVNDPADMLASVDGVLLARDDAENHLHFARPFLEAGVPLYIDKPVALSLSDMQALYRKQRYEGQLFTCSALRYASELTLSEADRERVGPIRYVQASTPRSWEKYAVHVIEPVLQLLGNDASVVADQPRRTGCGGRAVSLDFSIGITADVAALGPHVAGPISLRVHGELGWVDLVFADAFRAFRAALMDFVEGIRTRTCRSPYAFNERVVSIIETGLYA
jgi:predicted dehydrogenase